MKTKAVIENGFKETEIGLIPEDWEVVNVDKYIQFERGTEPGSENYNKDKKGVRFLRVVDISGSRDDKTYTTSKKLKLCKKKDILITFDGSPGIVKQGLEGAYSSGIRKVVIINKDLFSDYVYYVLQTIYVQRTIEKYTTGVTIKHSSKAILHIKIPFFSIQEQQKIAFVLLKIQQAIEQQHKIIETTRELKKSLMYKLFTEGLNGEEQKETEIGLMPKSWRIETVINIVEKTKQKNPSQTPELTFKYIDVSGISNEFYKIIEYRTYNGSKAPSRARKLVQTDDVLFATVRPTLRRMAYIDEKYNGEICSTAFCVLRSKKSILSSLYLYYCVQRDKFIEELAKLQKGASYPAITDNDVKRQQIPLPSFREQNEITDILSSIDKKISQAESKKQTLQALFRTMLNQLMTGKVRVKDFDFEVN